MKQIKILLTGSAGFIYSNFAKWITTNYDQYKIIGVDKLLFEHSHNNLFEHPNYKFYLNDFSDRHEMDQIFRIERPDWVVHSGAMSNVSDSIGSAIEFVQSNIVGTQIMIDMSLKYGVEKFLYCETDEVYGHITSNSEPAWTENTPINPRNPYSSTKAAGGLLVKAAGETHKLPYLITRASNNYGIGQSYKNLLPQILISAMTNSPIKIHGNGLQVRDWLWAIDNCRAVLTILEKSPMNEIYNIGGDMEMTNIDLVNYVYNILGKKPNIKHIKDRLGHDLKYSLDCSKMKNLGWKISSFDEKMKETISWYMSNKHLYLQ